MSSAHDLEIHYGRKLLHLAQEMGWTGGQESALDFVVRLTKITAQAEIANRVLEEGEKFRELLEREFSDGHTAVEEHYEHELRELGWCPPGHVPLPTNIEQAKLMNLVSGQYLEQFDKDSD
jgi:hypothetical protein